MADVLILVHAVDTTSGTILDWCESKNLATEVVPAEALGERRAGDYRALVLMGGDMEVWDTPKFPWLKREKELIGEFVDADKPVFGVCLGSQLLAERLGSSITAMGEWELGWFAVTLDDGRVITPFHCHQSKFDPPPGSATTASNAMDCTQGFRLGARYVGFQFHLEIDRTRIEYIVKNLKRSGNRHAGDPDTFVSEFERYGPALKEFCFAALDSWWGANF